MSKSETLEGAVRRALDAADHLTDADGAAVAAAVALARQLDEGEQSSTTWPTFVRLLGVLGLHPEGRSRLPAPPPAPAGRLAELRALHRERPGS